MASSKSGVRGMSLSELRGEIQRRHRELQGLVKRRAKLASQIEAIDLAIASSGIELGGAAAQGISAAMRSGGGAVLMGGRKRPRNDQNLADALAEVLSTQTLSVTEVSEEVQKHGYRTTSPNFRTIVNQTLIKDPRFSRVGRGLYTSKGSGAGSGRKRRRRRAAA